MDRKRGGSYKLKDAIKKLKEVRDSLKKTWSCQAGEEYNKLERERLINIFNGLIEDLQNGNKRA